ncbi:amidohydrolase family protein [Micromonospora wenchangensis]|uniref:amidohydrolase family protein n=1 Tax=Micromonospora wenchangensis TaxID=1185415 RepID=UPI00343307DB
MSDDSAKAAQPRRTRRRFLAMGGGAIMAAAVGVPVTRALTKRDPDRVVFPPAPPIRIDNVTVIDPIDGSRRPRQSVLVRDGRITAVTNSAAATTADVRAVDGAGRFVVPGYNNMHVHTLQGADARSYLATMLAEGVTGMRQMAASDDLLRYRAESRLPLTEYAPALLAMPGALISPFNAGSADDARTEVKRQKEQGADFIKIVVYDREPFLAALEQAREEGLVTAGHLPPDVSVTEASKLGYRSIEHFGTGSNIWINCSTQYDTLWGREQAALPIPQWVLGLPLADEVMAGQQNKRLINPAAFAKEEAVALLGQALDTFDEAKARELARTFVANGTWQTPTLVRLRTQYLADAPEYRQDPGFALMSSDERAERQDVLKTFDGLPATTHDIYRKAYELCKRMVGIFHDATVPMMTGTDGQGATPGQTMRLEFGEWAAAGIPPLDILRAATTGPAAYLGRSDRMGRIAAGMDADFLLLDADPLTDAANLSSVSAVIRAGHHLTRDQIQAVADQAATGDHAAGLRTVTCC